MSKFDYWHCKECRQDHRCKKCGKIIPHNEFFNKGMGKADCTGLCYFCAVEANRRADIQEKLKKKRIID